MRTKKGVKKTVENPAEVLADMAAKSAAIMEAFQEILLGQRITLEIEMNLSNISQELDCDPGQVENIFRVCCGILKDRNPRITDMKIERFSPDFLRMKFVVRAFNEDSFPGVNPDAAKDLKISKIDGKWRKAGTGEVLENKE